MKLYNVTFKWYDTDTYCANLAKAESEDDVKAYYGNKYGSEPIISEAPAYAMEDAERRGKPVVTVPHIEPEQEPTAAELPALQFERRGCEFFAGDPDNEESDIGNYRITTPGEIVPLKDGRMMLFEFACYDRQIWRYHNKRTGEKLKKPVLDSVFTCAMHIDTEYSKPEKTGDYEWRSSWRDLNMEKEFYKTPRKYTEKNILDYVNSVSAVQYGRIEYV